MPKTHNIYAGNDLPVQVKGHLKIEDDLGNILVDKDNAIHPQNMARAIARALSNESNYYIHRIAFGNGGTTIDAAFQVTFKTPNDGLPPDLDEWRSRLYNETYSEIIDDSNVNIGTDPGSSGPNVGTRPGGGANPSGDPTTVEHVSGPGVRSQELGLISQVIITSVLNPGEPAGQLTSDLDPNPATTGDGIENTEAAFVFDEIGLYTTGGPASASFGFQQIDLGQDRNSEDVIGLKAGAWYNLRVLTSGVGSPLTDYQEVTFQVPISTAIGSPVTIPSGSPISVDQYPDSNVTYGDLCEAINTQAPAWGPPQPLVDATIQITDNTEGSYPTITGATTAGFLLVQNTAAAGVGSTIDIGPVGSTPGLQNGTMSNPFDLLEEVESGAGATLLSPVDGEDAGVQNNAVNPQLERERLLSHIIFSPVAKTANRTLAITYTLTVSVARST